MNNYQTVSREEYRHLDNRATCILQQRWPANEISQWVGMLKGKLQVVACGHPAPPALSPCIAGPANHRPQGVDPVSDQS